MRLSAVAPGGPRAGDSGLSGQVLQRRQAVAGVADGRRAHVRLCREPTHPYLHRVMSRDIGHCWDLGHGPGETRETNIQHLSGPSGRLEPLGAEVVE